MTSDETPEVVDQLLDAPDLGAALQSDHFKDILDQVPVAIAVSQLRPAERICYANLEFERLTGRGGARLIGADWSDLPGEPAPTAEPRTLSRAVVEVQDYLGAFQIADGEVTRTVDAWSNLIDGEDDEPAFRLVALVETAPHALTILDQLQEEVREKDTQLRELQHRVKNNLQMITALIRVEARGVSDLTTGEGFDRLAGRVESLGLLYRQLSDSGVEREVDLGVYLSDIATAVIRAHAIPGITLDMQVDSWTVSIDVAMPTGLVVNELMTNALKHAFGGRESGTITLRCLLTGDEGCRVMVADDGVGLPDGATWPKPKKLSALIVESLLQNARAKLDVASSPGQGMRVTIDFDSKTPRVGGR